MLFTADLKAFSSYGLSSDSPSVTSSPKKKIKQAEIEALPTPPMTPTPRQLKRKPETDQELSHLTIPQPAEEPISLVKRVQKRIRRAL